jgi:hypothetical protein
VWCLPPPPRPNRRLTMNRDQNERAACLGMDPGLFFPEKSDTRGAAAAKEVCAACPSDVKVACLGLAVRGAHTVGIWAGSTSRERREYRRTGIYAKSCRRCDTTKVLSDFPLGNSRDGRHSWCKDCMRVYNRERRAA